VWGLQSSIVLVLMFGNLVSVSQVLIFCVRSKKNVKSLKHYLHSFYALLFTMMVLVLDSDVYDHDN